VEPLAEISVLWLATKLGARRRTTRVPNREVFLMLDTSVLQRRSLPGPEWTS
jgi:hypothetical protein